MVDTLHMKEQQIDRLKIAWKRLSMEQKIEFTMDALEMDEETAKSILSRKPT